MSIINYLMDIYKFNGTLPGHFLKLWIYRKKITSGLPGWVIWLTYPSLATLKGSSSLVEIGRAVTFVQIRQRIFPCFFSLNCPSKIKHGWTIFHCDSATVDEKPDPLIFLWCHDLPFWRWMKNTFELPLDPKIATAPCEWATSLPGVGAPPPPAPIAGCFFFNPKEKWVYGWFMVENPII